MIKIGISFTMNNNQISHLLSRHLATKSIFCGVYALDTLPCERRRRSPAAYIVNTDPHYLPGTHWILCYFPTTGCAEYFDSFGKIPPPKIREFLGKRYKYNRFMLQNIFSSVCGQYTIYYIFKRAEGFSMDQVIHYLHQIGPMLADDLVNSFVEVTFGADLDVYNQRFLFNQIAVSFFRRRNKPYRRKKIHNWIVLGGSEKET